MGNQGPVVQSIVSLTTSLIRQLVKYIWTTLSNMLLFLLEKNVRIFYTAKDSHIFSTKNDSIVVIIQNFNETLTNDVVNFEQPAPEFQIGI